MQNKQYNIKSVTKYNFKLYATLWLKSIGLLKNKLVDHNYMNHRLSFFVFKYI